MYVYARCNNKEQTEIYAIQEPRSEPNGLMSDGQPARASVAIIPVGPGAEIIRMITEGDERTGQPKLTIEPYDEGIPQAVLQELDPGSAIGFPNGILRSQAVKLFGESAVANAEKRALWSNVRAQRATLLSACDWTQLSDASLSSESKSAWAAYRQQLRDITSTYASPQDVVWPKKPK